MLVRIITLTMGLAASSLSLTLPAIAQQQFRLESTQLQAGAVIPVSLPDVAGTKYYYPDTAYEVSLTVDQDVYNSLGQIVIPVGSTVKGTMQPAQGGSQFVADSLQIQGATYFLQASSKVLTDVKDPRQTSDESIAEDAAIGAAAGAVIGAIAGDVNAGTVLGGAGAGVGIGNVTAPRVVVLDPDQSVQVFLQNPLVL